QKSAKNKSNDSINKTMKRLLPFISLFALMGGAIYSLRGGADNKSPVVHIKSSEVAAAFAKGRPLLETNSFKIHAGRREAPGIAEVHTWDTDIIYVLEGSATFVTGGTAIDPKMIAPGEIRGREIRDGEARQLVKGDVIIVPRGIPHWFKTVDGLLLYYVVKVTSNEGAKIGRASCREGEEG